jgi:hypothetical protein
MLSTLIVLVIIFTYAWNLYLIITKPEPPAPPEPVV